jgi:hypothetical protein
VTCYCLPDSCLLRQDEDSAYDLGAPSKFSRHGGRYDAALPIEGGQQFLNVNYPGLDLDDQEYSKGGQPGQNVDRATLPAQVEGVLYANLPAALAQVGHDQPHERGVALVEQPRKVGAAPPRL